jgi:hypothetical protein
VDRFNGLTETVKNVCRTVCKAVDRLKMTHRTSLTELDALFAALEQRAFNGELFTEKDLKVLGTSKPLLPTRSVD